MSQLATALDVLDRLCAGYARISDDKAGDAHGVDAQEAEDRDFGDEIGHPISVMYVDNDVSAFSGAERPHYQRLLDDIAAGRIAIVIIWHANRMHRSVEQVLAFIKLARAHKVRLFSVMLGGEYNLERASGREQLISDTLKAETESAHRGERIALARKRQARTANWGGGRRPYGWGVPFDPPRYRRVLIDKETREYTDVEMLNMSEHNPVEAAEIRRMADDVLARVPGGQIIADLKKRGVLTVSQTEGRAIKRRGKTLPPAQWTLTAVRQILTHPRVSGHAVHNGMIIRRDAWDSIIPEEKRQRIIEILSDPDRKVSPGNVPKWLGSLIFLCGLCNNGNRMNVRGNGSGVLQYKCESSSHNAVPALQLDEYISDVVVMILSRPDAAGLIQVQSEIDLDGLRAERADQQERKLTASRLFATGTIGADQLTEITRIADARLADIAEELRGAAAVDPLAEIVMAEHAGAAWQATPLGRRREVVRALMTVTLLPGAGKRDGRRIVDVDPDYVKIDPIRTPRPRHLSAVAQADADVEARPQTEVSTG